MFKQWTFVEVLIALGITLIFGILGYNVWLNATDPCLEKEPTGGMDCYTIGDYTQCEPAMRCIRRVSGPVDY